MGRRKCIHPLMSLSTPPSDFLNIFPKFSQEGRVQIKKLNKQTCQINYFDQLSEVGSMIQGKSGIKGYLMYRDVHGFDLIWFLCEATTSTT